MKFRNVTILITCLLYGGSLFAAGTNNQDATQLQSAGPVELECHGYLGDYVWYDTDGEGDQDETGTGIAGVNVRIRRYVGGSLAGTWTRTTDANGLYSYYFSQDGRYIIDIPNPPAGHTLTSGNTSYTMDINSSNYGNNWLYADFGYVKWDKSSLEVTGKCIWDSNTDIQYAVFTVTNTGTAAMQGPTTYELFINGVKVSDGQILPLNGGESRDYTFTSNDGDFIRFVAQQRPGHPGSSEPQDEVELDCKPSANPQIHIEKATNGQDADAPTGPTVNAGSTVTWTYAVTNPGNVPISN
ncbi:hypothetical protein JW948_19050, partial [bacterium]|nr:hypothetical protein [bacterium]